ncbi:protein shisa-5-like [Anopheles merus]|uniref:Uncharacterized protein n=1 Tax=Anopheles merus TaxID=30066 RepID=A0A182V7Q9_ANOME|nr:protein shisa-5-like [Anopheles merus]
MDMIAVVGSAMIVGFIVYWCIRCCCTRSNSGAVLATPITITSEVHRVAPPGTTQTVPPPPPGAIIKGHPTGTAAYPAMPTAYPTSSPAPYPAQPYMQHYPYQTSAAPTSMPPPQPNTAASVQFPALPSQMQIPILPSASAPPAGAAGSAAMMNPPSYDQVVNNSYPVQAPYNPDFKG